MTNMRLNSLSKDLFMWNDNDEKDVKVGTGANAISRNRLIAQGRMCAVEYAGKIIGGNPNLNMKYTSRLESFGGDIRALSKKHADEKLIFCAAMAYAALGKGAPESAVEVRKDRSLVHNPIFRSCMSAIDVEVVTPLLFSVLSDLNGMVMDITPVGLNETKEIEVKANEAFVWEDSSLGSSHSVARQYLYNDVVTLNPRAFSASTRIKWSQLASENTAMDMGEYYMALVRGLQSKMTALATSAFVNAANTGTGYISNYLYFQGFSNSNWFKARKGVAAANGVGANALMAFGDIEALAAVIPSGTPSDAALTYGLGNEWMKTGFISAAAGIPLYEVLPAMVPGTVNSTGAMIGLPNDRIYISARSAGGRAPVQAAMVDGWPVTLEYTARETSDFTIYVNMTTLLDVKPVFANKIAVIDDVTLSGT